jgi:hypothetical protein
MKNIFDYIVMTGFALGVGYLIYLYVDFYIF